MLAFTEPAASASEVTTVWRYINWSIIIIIIIIRAVTEKGDGSGTANMFLVFS